MRLKVERKRDGRGGRYLRLQHQALKALPEQSLRGGEEGSERTL